MNVLRLTLSEIRHRKLNFLLMLLSVTVATACLVGALTLLRADEIRTQQILKEKQQEVEQAGAKLNDAMRKITKGLGFNVLILPEDQDLSELHLEGSLSSTMPEQYVERLANSSIISINHLLPTITEKIEWTEIQDRLPEGQKKLDVLLIGTRGEVPLMHRDPKKPLLDAVAPGSIVVGYEIHQTLKLQQGDCVSLRGREFTVAKLHEQRGNIDDSTLWINLAEAQALLGKQNLIHSILALECHCTGDRITQIRNEISAILPGTQVIERGPPALARAEARNKTAEAAKASLEREVQGRAGLRRQREGFAAVLMPLVLVASAAWIGLLAFGNVKERTAEIGILRAIGFRSYQILGTFLGKALVIGILGGALGYPIGFAVAMLWGDLPLARATAQQLFVPATVFLAVVLAPTLSGVASWVPAMLAVRQDPAVVLQEG